jgi:hypothetical protein
MREELDLEILMSKPLRRYARWVGANDLDPDTADLVFHQEIRTGSAMRWGQARPFKLKDDQDFRKLLPEGRVLRGAEALISIPVCEPFSNVLATQR